MSRWNLTWLLGFTAITFVGLSMSQSAPSRDGQLQGKYENLRLMVDVLEEVQQRYVRDLSKKDMRELVENMINSGLERLDPHSAYLNAEEYKMFLKQSQGTFGGIGIKLGLDPGGRLYVETPMAGTPAYEAGILAGDLIVKIEGISTENMSMKKAVELIQGEPGKKITLTVLHEGTKKPEDIPITRAQIVIDTVLGDQPLFDNLKKWDFTLDRANRIAYIRLVQFSETTKDELTKVVDLLQKENMRGLILDLRDNPGGLLRSAVQVSSMFLPEGDHVVTTKPRNGREESYDAKREPKLPQVTGIPIAILLNRYSASASEIVAAALQDHARAVVIGERSYGKGSVQNIIAMDGGKSGAIKLTTAAYWRPNKKNIHRFPDSKEEDDWGVKPTVRKDDKVDFDGEVKLTDEERRAYYKYRRERDVLRKAIAPKAGAKEFKDRVLEKALEYIRSKLANAEAPPRQQPDPQAAVPAPARQESRQSDSAWAARDTGDPRRR
jgi:carboxyl-terminal processing protease